MPFQNDEQRRAAFARMKGKGTSGGGQPSNTTGGAPPIFETLAHLFNTTFTPKPKGPGVDYTQGTFTGTGGAIYQTPASNWFVAPEQSPVYGNLPGYGVGPYVQQWTPGFQPSSGLAAMYDIFILGIDPHHGQRIPRWGEPGYMGLMEGSSLDMSPNKWQFGPPRLAPPRPIVRRNPFK